MNDFTSADKINLERDLDEMIALLSEDNAIYGTVKNDIEELRDNFIEKGKAIFYSQVHNLYVRHLRIIPNNNTLSKVKEGVLSIWKNLTNQEKFNIINPTGSYMLYPIFDQLRVNIIELVKERIDEAVASGKLKECGNLSSVISGISKIQYTSDNEGTDPIFEVSTRNDNVLMNFFINSPEYQDLKQIVVDTIMHNV